MEMAIEVRKELNSFEFSELERLLATIEENLLYSSGLHFINGGYANADAYEMDDIFVLIEGVYGEQNMGDGCSSENKRLASISREVLDSKTMNLKEKLEKVIWG